LVLPEDVATIVSYNMNHAKRGRIVAICNSKFEPQLCLNDRSGHQKDIAALKDTFSNMMQFEWNILENQTAFNMYRAMLEGNCTTYINHP